jgi:acetyl esterase/lipase
MKVRPLLHASRILARVGCPLLLALVAVAQAPPLARDIPPAPQAGEFTLKTSTPSPAITHETWVQLVDQPAVLVAQNVSTPTLAPFLPTSDKATGAAVIIAPGGGFLMLSMESEGWALARRLQSEGIAAFVLKYRLEPSEPGAAGLVQSIRRLANGVDTPEFKPTLEHGIQLATEDAKEAMHVVRARAGEWKIDPARVGFLGFSAGAWTALNLAYTSDSETRPAFIAPIYGPMGTPFGTVPASPPPMWVALASNDPLFGKSDFLLINAWRAKGGKVEFHFYEKGGHGFGYPGKPGTTTMHWADEFLWWLKSDGLLMSKK